MFEYNVRAEAAPTINKSQTVQELPNTNTEKEAVDKTESSKTTENPKVATVQPKTVTLTVNGKKKTYKTKATTVKALLKEQKISVNSHDIVKPAATTKIKDKMNISVKHAKKVTLIVAGKKKTVWTHETSVKALLSKNKVKYDSDDSVSPGRTKAIKNGMTVKVDRISYKTNKVTKAVKYKTVYKNDSSLDKGKKKVSRNGKNGSVTKSYKITYKNGKKVKTKLVKTTKKNAVNKIVLVGTKVKKQETVANMKVKKTIQVSATAYTAYCKGCSGITAAGYNLKKNPNMKVIAVDPRIIPLGTKVYVPGYGVAIAGDTGGAIKGNKIDIFMSSHNKAIQFGRKTITIKVLA